MSATKTSSTKLIFLFLLHEGGWWTANELAQAFSDKPDAWKFTYELLTHLVKSGCISKRRSTPDVRANGVEFGVTRACLVPRGITLEELQA